MKNFSVLLFLTCLLPVPELSAQGAGNDTITYRNIGEVIVTASRVAMPLNMNPGAVSLVSAPVLSTMPRTVAVDEALRLVPGVRIDNQADGSRVHLSIRGQGILSEHGLRGIKVLLDGIPLNDPSGFASDLYDIDWAAVNRVEVLRGPSASLYGGGSNAGILNIVTSSGGDRPFGGSVLTTGGSNGFYKIHTDAGGTDGNVRYNLNFANFGGDGYRDHTAFRGTIFSDKVTFSAGEKVKITQVLIFSHYYNQNAEGLNLSQLDNPRQSNPDAIPCNEYQDTKRMTGGLIAGYRLSDNQSISLSAYVKSTSYTEPGSSAVAYNRYLNPGGTIEYDLNSRGESVRNHFSAGLDYQFQDIDGYKLPNIKDPSRTEKRGEISYYVKEGDSLLANQDIKQSSFGLFAIDRMEIGPKVNTIFSIRYDNLSNRLTDRMDSPDLLSGSASFEKVSARIGLSYDAGRSVKIYANAGQGFLPPSTEELINNPVSFGGFNQGLKPATSLGEEAGIRGYILNSMFYDITVFNLDTKNDFYRYRVPSRPLETFYGNAGSSKRMGAEFFVNWNITKGLDFQLAYTWSDFKYASPDSIKGNQLPNSPVHQLYADAAYRFGKHLTAGVSLEMQSKWYIYTDASHGSISQDGFALFHARIAYDLMAGKIPVSISLNAKNIGNKQYIAFTEPDPDGNSYQPSALREIFAAVRISF
ncbi:MAG TPA: TonB-dependent receptor [Bacteroidales bacterium]|nr:TonB-dependent receptor [Bacteroidales bacterium]